MAVVELALIIKYGTSPLPLFRRRRRGRKCLSRGIKAARLAAGLEPAKIDLKFFAPRHRSV